MSSAALFPSRLLAWTRAHPRRIAVLAVLGLALGWLWPGSEKAGPVKYRTDTVTEGPLLVKVSATGNLQPTNQVDVGSELSGIVEKVFVDDNDQVRKGQVLAVLDLSKLNDAVSKSRANLVASEAAVVQADATAAESRATWQRQQQVAKLSGGKVPSQSELDVAEAAWKPQFIIHNSEF